MKIAKKGEFGYIKSRRILTVIMSVVLLVMVLVMYFTARSYFGTNKNLFTILAALICLPLGKSIVNNVMFFRASGCSESAMNKIEAIKGNLPDAYDLYMTSYSDNFAISHAVIGSGCVAALTESDKCKVQEAEKHIRERMEQDKFTGYTIKVFDNTDKYLQRVGQLAQNGEKDAHSEAILNLLKAVSL